MIGYLDTSALVKRYVAEPGSDLVERFLAEVDAPATVALSRVELSAALAKAVRVGALRADEALTCRRLADQDWPHLVRLPVTESTVDRAAMLAWSENLRGYDAVQLAAACAWQETLDQGVSFASFDGALWQAAGRYGLVPFPPDLPALLDDWRGG
jgi:uncharacterized protein